MKDLLCDDFQNTVANSLVRHRSILDVVSKFQEASARVNRAVVKAVTNCGCVTIEASKPVIPPDITLQELRNYMPSHVEGTLCESCKDAIEDEIGKVWFYCAALSNIFDLNLYDILIKEHKRIAALGVYSLD